MDIPDKKTQLTPKQEKFCLVYLETGNASEAYRRAYDAGGMSDTSINRKAKELLDNGKISARLSALRAPILKRHAITVDSLLAELEEARRLALETEAPAHAVAATMGKAKLLGYDKQILDLRSSDRTMSPSAPAVATEVLTKLNQAHGD